MSVLGRLAGGGGRQELALTEVLRGASVIGGTDDGWCCGCSDVSIPPEGTTDMQYSSYLGSSFLRILCVNGSPLKIH